MELLERARELDELDGWLREAAAGHGRLALVGGEAGVGKTTLVAAFCHEVAARGRARVLLGACDPLSTPRPLGPLQDVAAQAGGELDRLLERNAPRDRLFRACLAELGGGLTPAVVVVEDAHWADEATLDLLRFLGRRFDPVRALLIVTYRDDEVGPTHPLRLVLGDLATAHPVRRLSLAPLSPAAVAALAAGSGLDAGELHRLTGGNPFFVTEILASGQAMLPGSVRDVVLARVARLTEEGRAALEAAAVIGLSVSPDLLAAVAGAAATAIDACVEGGMLREQAGELAFRHELARQAVLDAIAAPRRTALHARVLRALEEIPEPRRDLARLAHHAEAAGDRRAVLAYAPPAARHAAALRAHREAAAQYDRALRFAADLPAPDRARLLDGRAYECYLTGQPVAAIDARREALAIWRAAGEPVKVGENLRWLSRLYWFVGRRADAEAAAQEAIATLETTTSKPQLAWAYSNLAQLLLLSSENREAAGWAERALALAEEVGEPEIAVHALNNLGAALTLSGDARGWEPLEQSLQTALALGLEEHVARAWTNLAAAAIASLQIAATDRYVREGIAYATEHDLDAWRLFLIASRAEVRFYQGDWTAAVDDATLVLRRTDASLVTRVPALTTIARVAIRRGDPAAAAALAEAYALSAPTGELQWLGPIHAARAEAADLAGDRRRTAEEARALFDLARRRGELGLRGELAYWLWRAGEPVADHGPLLEPFGLQIAGDWRAAAAAWDDLGCPYEAARARAEGDVEDALRAALATFERLGARPMAARTARRLRAFGARAIPRGPRPATHANPARLTPRELEVLALVAAGQRNAEIAARLYLSPKTVDHHVSALLAKLGVHSRQEAAAAAGRLGIALPPARDAEASTPR